MYVYKTWYLNELLILLKLLEKEWGYKLQRVNTGTTKNSNYLPILSKLSYAVARYNMQKDIPNISTLRVATY